MKTRLLIIAGMLLLGVGIVLHFYFLSLDVIYLETFSNHDDCKIILSGILNNLNKTLENNCPVQLHLLQSVFVKLFGGLGIILIIGGTLIYSGSVKNDN